MKHVGLNVAADPLFTIAYSGTPGGLVIVSADDPGMASSQNEQDNRRYAVAAGVPMLEPADSQECYDFTIRAFELSEQYRRPILLRVTTRVCHSKCILQRRDALRKAAAGHFDKDPKSNVMIPAYARIAHRKLRATLHELEKLNERGEFTRLVGDYERHADEEREARRLKERAAAGLKEMIGADRAGLQSDGWVAGYRTFQYKAQPEKVSPAKDAYTQRRFFVKQL